MTGVPQTCYKCFVAVLQEFRKSTTKVLLECHCNAIKNILQYYGIIMGVLPTFLGSVTRVLQECCKSDIRVWQGFDKSTTPLPLVKGSVLGESYIEYFFAIGLFFMIFGCSFGEANNTQNQNKSVIGRSQREMHPIFFYARQPQVGLKSFLR